MTEYASATDLTEYTAEDEAEDFTLANGLTVRVRGLTRTEHLWIGKGTDDAAEIEARMLSKALLMPPMTLEQIKEWQKSGASKAVSEISDKVRELSGFAEAAAKRALAAAGD